MTRQIYAVLRTYLRPATWYVVGVAYSMLALVVLTSTLGQLNVNESTAAASEQVPLSVKEPSSLDSDRSPGSLRNPSVEEIRFTPELDRKMFIPQIYFASLFITAIIAHQLSAQFYLPGSHVIPRYSVPHQIGGLLAGAILMTPVFICLLSIGLPVSVTIAMVLFGPASVGLTLVLIYQQRVGWRFLALIPIFAQFLVMIQLGFAAFDNNLFNSSLDAAVSQSRFESFWAGNQPVLTGIVITVELMCLAAYFLRLPALTHWINEECPALPKLTLEIDLSRQWPTAHRQKHLTWFIDRDTARLRFHQNSLWKVVQLWRIGNIVKPLPTACVFFCMMVLFSLAMPSTFLNSIPIAQTHFRINPRLFCMLVMMIFCGFMLPAMAWLTRKKFEATDILRPVDRRSYVRQIFLAFAMDHWVGILALLIAVVAIIFHLPPDARTLLSTPILLMALTFVIWVFAAGSSLLAFQIEWVAGLIACIVLGTGMTGILGQLVTGAAESNLASSSDRMLAISISSIVMGGLGGIVIYWMYHRALRREWS